MKDLGRRKSRENRDARVGQGQVTECAARLAADDEARDSAVDERGAEPAPVGKLRDEHIGNIFDGAIDQDEVEGRILLRSRLERPFHHLESVLACRCRQHGRAFQRNDRKSDRLKHGGRVTGAGPDDERALSRQRQHLRQEGAEDGRRRQETAVAHRNAAVGIGERARLGGKEFLARDRGHRAQHRGVRHPLRTQLAFNHRATRGCEIGDRALHGHSCYMPITQLEFKLELHIRSLRPRQPPFIERRAAPPAGLTER